MPVKKYLNIREKVDTLSIYEFENSIDHAISTLQHYKENYENVYIELETGSWDNNPEYYYIYQVRKETDQERDKRLEKTKKEKEIKEKKKVQDKQKALDNIKKLAKRHKIKLEIND